MRHFSLKPIWTLFIVLSFLLLLGLPAAAEPPDRSDKNVRLKVFIHYPRPDRGGAKPGKPINCDVCDAAPGESTLFSFFAQPPAQVTYSVNTASIPSSVADVEDDAVTKSFDTWNTKWVGSFTRGADTTLSRYRYDGVWLVTWGRVTYPNAIAVSYLWIDETGKIVEADIIMNSKLPWAYTSPSSVADVDAACGNLCAYDAQNILTHEVGHWLGLDDLYKDYEENLTMFGYGRMGELEKDTLGPGDILGVQSLLN